MVTGNAVLVNPVVPQLVRLTFVLATINSFAELCVLLCASGLFNGGKFGCLGHDDNPLSCHLGLDVLNCHTRARTTYNTRYIFEKFHAKIRAFLWSNLESCLLASLWSLVTRHPDNGDISACYTGKAFREQEDRHVLSTSLWALGLSLSASGQ